MAPRKKIKIFSIEIGKDTNEHREQQLEALINDGWEIVTSGGTTAGSAGFVFVILQRDAVDDGGEADA